MSSRFPVHVAATCSECVIFLRLIPAAKANSNKTIRRLVDELFSSHLRPYRAISGVEPAE